MGSWQRISIYMSVGRRRCAPKCQEGWRWCLLDEEERSSIRAGVICCCCCVVQCICRPSWCHTRHTTGGGWGPRGGPLHDWYRTQGISQSQDRWCSGSRSRCRCCLGNCRELTCRVCRSKIWWSWSRQTSEMGYPARRRPSTPSRHRQRRSRMFCNHKRTRKTYLAPSKWFGARRRE